MAVAVVAAAVAISSFVGSTCGCTTPSFPNGTTANLWIDADGGTCTRSATPAVYSDAAACSSMNAAYLAASAGDTVRSKTGSYPSQTIDYDATHYAFGSRVIFEMAGVDMPSLTSYGGAHVEVRGLTLTGSNAVGASFTLRSDDSSSPVSTSHPALDWVLDGGSMKIFQIRTATNVTIKNMDIGNVDVYATGMDTPKVGAYDMVDASPEKPATNITLTQNVFHDIYSSNGASSHPECLYLEGNISGLTISRNKFYGCGEMDIHGDPTNLANDTPADSVTIENNFFDYARNTNDGTIKRTDISLKGTAGWNNFVIRYNTFLGNFLSEVGTSWSNPSIYGNVFVDHTACADALSASAWTAKNMMDAVPCGTSDVTASAGLVSSSSANCTLGSCFSNDLRLASTLSPAVDAGGVTYPSVDYDGDTRPLGSGPDLGADEKG